LNIKDIVVVVVLVYTKKKSQLVVRMYNIVQLELVPLKDPDVRMSTIAGLTRPIETRTASSLTTVMGLFAVHTGTSVGLKGTASASSGSAMAALSPALTSTLCQWSRLGSARTLQRHAPYAGGGDGIVICEEVVSE